MNRNISSQLYASAGFSNQGSLGLTIAGRLPTEIEDGIARMLANAQPELLNDITIRNFRELIKSRGTPDYSKDWANFSYLYFGANYVKNYLVGRQFPIWRLSGPLHIVDLGCGSGASLAGFLSGLADQQVDMTRVLSIVAVDGCQQQLQVFQAGVLPWLKKFFPFTEIRLQYSNLLTWCLKAPLSTNIILASYVCSELDDSINRSMRQELRNRFVSTSCVCQIVESHSGSSALEVEDLDGHVQILPYDEVSLELSWRKRLQLKESAKFSVDDTDIGLLFEYFSTWETHNIEALRRIFSVDAVYEICGVKTLCGLEEIVRYWKHNAERQRNINWSFSNVVRLGNHIAATWKASFERIDVMQLRDLNGIIDLAIQDGKILKLTEAYEQKRQSISP